MAETAAPRLHEKYKADSVPALMKKLGYTKPMQVPRQGSVVPLSAVG